MVLVDLSDVPTNIMRCATQPNMVADPKVSDTCCLQRNSLIAMKIHNSSNCMENDSDVARIHMSSALVDESTQ